MKIQTQKTQSFYVFASPVTVNRSENILLQGIEDKTFVISSPFGKTSRTGVSDGSIILKPYEMVNGVHCLSSMDDRGRSTPFGTLLIVEDKATVSMLDYGSAIKALAVTLNGSVKRIEQTESAVNTLQEQSKIGLAQRKEEEQ